MVGPFVERQKVDLQQTFYFDTRNAHPRSTWFFEPFFQSAHVQQYVEVRSLEKNSWNEPWWYSRTDNIRTKENASVRCDKLEAESRPLGK